MTKQENILNPRIGQVALVTSDMHRTLDFYTTVFELDHVFGTNAFRGEGIDAIQGLTMGAASTQWLLDGRPGFQLEIFQYEHLQSKPLAENNDPEKTGYNRVIIAVTSLEKTLARVNSWFPVSAPVKTNQGDKRSYAVIKDPNGVVLELLEEPSWVADGFSSCIVGVGLTTSDITTLSEDLCDGFGFKEVDENSFDHDHIWNSYTGTLNHKVFQQGDMYVLASQPEITKPRDNDLSLTDIGIMNFAMLFNSHEQFDKYFAAASALGMKPNCKPMIERGKAQITYNNTREGFSLEMVYLAKPMWGLYGFTKPTWADKLLTKVLEWKAARDYKKHIKKQRGA